MVSNTAKRPTTENVSRESSAIAGLGVRIFVLAAALIGSIGAFQHSYFAWLRQSDSKAAYELRPDDPAALSAHILDQIAGYQTYSASSEDVAHARASLVREPLSSPSLWILGKSAEESGDMAKATTAMELASRVARRNILSQLWLIERSVANDDISKAMSHYHAALSADERLEGSLIPILSQAMSFPEVRSALAPYLARQARWMPSLIGYAADNAKIEDLEAFVMPRAGQLASARYAAANARIIGRLARERGGGAAMDFAAKSVPGFKREAAAAAGFSRTTTDARLGALAWKLTQDSAISTIFENDGKLKVTLQPEASGIVATRDFPVKPGATYELGHKLGDTGIVEGGNLVWEAECVSLHASGAIERFDLAWPAKSGVFRRSILIPPRCGLLRLGFHAEGPDTQFAAELQISGLTLLQR